MDCKRVDGENALNHYDSEETKYKPLVVAQNAELKELVDLWLEFCKDNPKLPQLTTKDVTDLKGLLDELVKQWNKKQKKNDWKKIHFQGISKLSQDKEHETNLQRTKETS